MWFGLAPMEFGSSGGPCVGHVDPFLPEGRPTSEGFLKSQRGCGVPWSRYLRLSYFLNPTDFEDDDDEMLFGWDVFVEEEDATVIEEEDVQVPLCLKTGRGWISKRGFTMRTCANASQD